MLLLVAGPLMAQSAGRLDVAVQSRARVPLPNVAVTFTHPGDSTIRLATDSSGRVLVPALAVGVWRVSLRQIGFSPADLALRVGPGDNAETVRLDRNAAALDTVRVVGGRRVTSRLDEFETRRALGLSTQTITSAEIDKRNPFALSQMLQNVPSLRVADSAGHKVAISSRGLKKMVYLDPVTGRRTEGLVNCMLQTVVDNVLMPYGFNLDEISVREVHGIEIFAGAARTPPQFSSLRTDSWCGLIVIWTKDR
jgi:hypothetical protein